VLKEKCQKKKEKMVKGKGGQLRTLRRCCQSIVLHVDEVVAKEKEEKRLMIGIGRAQDRVMKYTGLGKSSLLKMRSAKPEELLAPGERERRGGREAAVTDEDKATVRPAIAKVVIKKENVTLDAVLDVLKEDYDLRTRARPSTTRWTAPASRFGSRTSSCPACQATPSSSSTGHPTTAA